MGATFVMQGDARLVKPRAERGRNRFYIQKRVDGEIKFLCFRLRVSLEVSVTLDELFSLKCSFFCFFFYSTAGSRVQRCPHQARWEKASAATTLVETIDGTISNSVVPESPRYNIYHNIFIKR